MGIRLHGYHTPYAACNQPLYGEGYAELEKRMSERCHQMQKSHPGRSTPPLPNTDREKRKTNAHSFVEETQACILGNGMGAESLCRKLGRYIGISKGDTEARSYRFTGYVHCMTEGGELPTLQEFCATNSPDK